MKDFLERLLVNDKATTVVEYGLVAVMIAFTAAFVAHASLVSTPLS